MEQLNIVRTSRRKVRLRRSNNRICDFYGRTIATFDSQNFKEFNGMIKYKIDGSLTRREILALIAVIYIL